MFRTSGEEVLAVQFEEFLETAAPNQEPVQIVAVKRHLEPFCKQPRFKQRLLLVNGPMLPDDFVLTGPMDVQLILQPFARSSEDQIRKLQQAARENNILGMEGLLQRPQDPDLAVDA